MFLDAVEQEQYRKSQAWIEAPEGVLGKALGWIGKPIDLAYRAVPESVKESVSSSLYQVLLQVREHSRDTVRRQGLYDRISQEVGTDASQPQNLARLPLGRLDEAAMRVLNAHRSLAVVQGGVTGAAGLAGLVADVPSLYFLIFRCVEEIACCYGFPADSDVERDHVLKVVDVGHFLESENKRRGMLELETYDEMLRRGAPVKDLERTVVAKGLQNLSRQLSSRLVQRKLAQTVAVIGAFIGAGVNAALVNDIGLTAIHAYRRRRLRQTALRRMELADATAVSADDPAAASESQARPGPRQADEDAPAAESDTLAQSDAEPAADARVPQSPTQEEHETALSDAPAEELDPPSPS